MSILKGRGQAQKKNGSSPLEAGQH